MKLMRILVLISLAASLMVFMGGCISNKDLGYCDAKPIFPGFTWSKERAEEYAHYHDAGRNYRPRFRLESDSGGYRGDGYRKAHDYYEPRSGW